MTTIRHIYSALHERAVRRVDRAPLVHALLSRILK